MNSVSLKDLTIMVRHLRFDINSAKRQLEYGSGGETYLRSLKRKIEILEPVVEKYEFLLDNLNIQIDIKGDE